MAKNKSQLKSSGGFWILLVAAVVLEATACLQYFYSRAAIDREAVDRARAELRAAELEINAATVELEAAEGLVISSHFPFALQHMDGDCCLVVGCS